MCPSLTSPHFTLQPLAEDVYACIHKPGGAAFSNAGIISLGMVTLVVDALNSMAAGRDLRRIAETLFDCPVETLIFTHGHNDHWIGATAFDEVTTLLASETTSKLISGGMKRLLADFNAVELRAYLHQTEQRLATETDERVRVGLNNALIRTRAMLEELPDYQPRLPDHTFTDQVDFYGTLRRAELRSMKRGHSQDDAVLFLPDDGIAFVGDIGFFKTQPYMADCDLALYRQQLRALLDSDYQILVPGHGPVGGKADIEQQLNYMDMLEERMDRLVKQGAALEEALRLELPEPFSAWLLGGIERFKLNVRMMYRHCGGKIPDGS